MMAAILNSAILHKTLTQTSSICLKLIYSYSTWWWQPSWILPSWIQRLPSWIQTKTLLIHSDSDFTQKHSHSTLNSDSNWIQRLPYNWIHGNHLHIFCSSSFNNTLHSILTLTQTSSTWLKLIHSHLTWWWQPSWIQPFCSKFWLQLIQSDSNSFILIQLDDGSHLEFCHLEICHLGFSHLIISSQTHSHLPRLDPTICTKKLHWFILTPLDDGNHLEFCHLGFKHLVFFSEIHSKTLSPLWLWLKLIQSDSNSFISHSTWWWQQSWILPICIQPS